MQEKRKYPRFDVVAKIRVKKVEGKGSFKEAFVKNISAEGFCFYSKEQFNPGGILEIDIIEKKMEEAPICIKGEVVWCDKNAESGDSQHKDSFLTGVKVLGVRKTDEARFAMLYCERMLVELKSFLRM
ncbi:MAG: PilZ domain-containing protein [Candidatus Omnitrophica bacterium]|nr:PilZ domain-containing protein [Candidatus Omnitrophota bacterium]